MKKLDLPPLLKGKPVSELIKNKPPLGHLHDYEFYSSDGDKLSYFYLWSDNNEVKLGNDTLGTSRFYVPASITYATSINYLNASERYGFDIRSFSFNNIIEEDPSKDIRSTGYVKPQFHFIDYLKYSLSEIIDEYQYTVDKFNLNKVSLIEPSIFIQLGNYRDLLLSQLYRQAKEIESINKKIKQILQVYNYHIWKSEHLSKDVQVLINFQVNHLFTQKITKGAYSKSINIDSIELDFTDDQTLTYLSQITTKGISFLTKTRDPILKVAKTLSDKVSAIEMIIEHAIIDDKLLSKKDLLYHTMPNPLEVAKGMYSKARRKDFSPKEIAFGMSITQKYIIDNDIDSLRLNLHPLACDIVRNTHIWVDKTPALNTVKNWITKYAIAAGISLE